MYHALLHCATLGCSQEGYYGRVGGLRATGHETDEQLIASARSLKPVANARRLCHTWLVVTAIYREPKQTIMPPRSHAPLAPDCWLAFVDRPEHTTPGWVQAPLVLFDEYSRNANAIKVIVPLLFEATSSIFYLDFSLTRARCMAFPHLVRAKELTPTLAPAQALHLYASAIPSWSGRSSVPVQIDLTRSFIRKQKDARAEMELDALEKLMRADPSFNASSFEKRLIPDTLWMAWPATNDGIAQRLAKSWFHEVARRSSFEKASFAWVASKLPLRRLFVNAVYIYEAHQRCNCSATSLPTPGLSVADSTAGSCRPQFPGATPSNAADQGKKKKGRRRLGGRRRRSSR